MKKIFLVFILSSIFLYASVNTKVINISGSSTIYPSMEQIISNYNHNQKFNLKGGGSGSGIKNVLNNTSHIGMVSRSLKSDNLDSDIKSILLGYDGIAVIVNSDLPINKLTNKQIKDIFEGKIKNWKSINKINEDIQLIIKEKGRSTRKLFDKFFNIKKVSTSATIIGSNFEVITYVAGTPNAIGYVSIGAAYEAKKLGLDLKILPLNGIEANIKNIRTKSYPLIRELNLIYNEKNKKDLEQFLKFLDSEKVYNIIEKSNYIRAK